jgi:hypothetical protein
MKTIILAIFYCLRAPTSQMPLVVCAAYLARLEQGIWPKYGVAQFWVIRNG